MLRWSIVLSVFAIIENNVQCQDDCSVLPEGILDHGIPDGCCDLGEWTETVQEKKCNKEPVLACRCECLFREEHLVYSNGTMNAANVKHFFEAELAREPHYIPIAIKWFEICLPLGLKAAHNNKPKKGDCDYAPALVMDCVIRNMFINCLPSKWKTSPRCEAAKKHMEKCPVRHVE